MIRIADLFCGIGGFRLGIERAAKKQNVQVECVFSSEIEKNAVKIYEKNFQETPSGDITKINADDIPDMDILCGGFPCQAFSIAGNRRGFEDTRGTLFFDIARIAKEKRPKMLFLENVKGLLSSKTVIPFEYAAQLLNDEIVGNAIWVDQFTPKSNWIEFENCLRVYLQKILRKQLELNHNRSDTSSLQNLDCLCEHMDSLVEFGLLKKLKFLAMNLLQITRKTKCYQTEVTLPLECKDVDLNSILRQLCSVWNLKTLDTYTLDKTILTLGEIEKSLRNCSEENSHVMKLFTTSMEINQTIDQKTSTYVQELNILLFIVKQWKLSTDLWKWVTSNLMRKQESMYYVRTFNIIIQTLSELGYECECQLLNSKDFGVPQNRERVFIIGHLRGGRTRQIFPVFGETGETVRENISNCIDSNYFKGIDNHGEKTHIMCYPVLTPDRMEKRQNGRRIKNADEPMFTLTAQDKHGVLIQHYCGEHQQDRVLDPNGVSSCLPTGTGGDLIPKFVIPNYSYMPDGYIDSLDTAWIEYKNHGLIVLMNGRRFERETLDDGSLGLWREVTYSAIRKLTPVECERLQGFPDGWTAGISDSGRYKCLGNAVTVNVIEAIAEKILKEVV